MRDRHLRCITANKCLNVCEGMKVAVRNKDDSLLPHFTV